jgi:hypothetical protein
LDLRLLPPVDVSSCTVGRLAHAASRLSPTCARHVRCNLLEPMTEIELSDLDTVTGGDLRSWSYGALTALSIGMGNPADRKIDQPILNPAPIVQTIGPGKK